MLFGFILGATLASVGNVTPQDSTSIYKTINNVKVEYEIIKDCKINPIKNPLKEKDVSRRFLIGNKYIIKDYEYIEKINKIKTKRKKEYSTNYLLEVKDIKSSINRLRIRVKQECTERMYLSNSCKDTRHELRNKIYLLREYQNNPMYSYKEIKFKVDGVKAVFKLNTLKYLECNQTKEIEIKSKLSKGM